MQDKRESAIGALPCERPEKRRIVVPVSWDSDELGDAPWLVGEWSDWEERTLVIADDRLAPMLPEATPIRHGRAELELEEGVYAYKVRSPTGYALNRAEPRTATSGPHTNSVLSVGGSLEPILHVAAPPYVHYPAEGGVIVSARVRKGVTTTLHLDWQEGEPVVHACTAMIQTAEDATHLHFRAHLPASARVARYTFRLDDGTSIARSNGAPFVIQTVRETAPWWWADAVVYTVFVDRFRSTADAKSWDVDPGPGAWAGGDLAGIRRSLAYLADLGVNTLYLTPIHVGKSCHRYDLVDPTRVDPLLGGEEALTDLLDELKARGMRLLLDWSFCHAGTDFIPYQDVQMHGRSSRYANWFQWKTREQSDRDTNSPDRPDASQCAESNEGAAARNTHGLAHYAGCSNAPLLDLNQADLAEMALSCAERWIRSGIDGLRIDCAAQVPISLLSRLRRRVRAVNPEAVVVGELIPEHAWRWRSAGALDASTDFAFHRLARDRFASPRGSEIDLEARWECLLQERGIAAPREALRFISTHDFPRFFSLTRAAGLEGNDPLALVWLLTMPGVPMLLYGEEIGMRADVAELDTEGVWRDRAPYPWSRAPSTRSDGLLDLVRELLSLRRNVRALVHGEVESMLTDGPVWTYRRRDGEEIVDIVIYQGDEPLVVEVSDDEFPRATLLFQRGGAAVDKQVVSFAGRGAIVLRRAPAERSALSPTLVRRRDSLFRSGGEEAGLPRRWDVSLTEHCNLRCAHCITFAPERTVHGGARAMTPFVLSRLRSALSFVEHVGFVHGGEALTSPLLFDFLGALREARREAPTMVHLLTNGMLLTEDMTHKLVHAGVRSISVSLDGASAGTNDFVRKGGTWSEIVGHLKRATRARTALSADLRLGISTVVLPNNVRELVAIVELAARLELDWVKFEELVPATAFAKTSILRLEDAVARDAVEAACHRGTELGLVVVDHLAAMPRFVCELDASPRDRRRHHADEFANRTSLNPCRDAWELACIEPNGDIRAGSFTAAIAGNITEQTMLSLWNGPVARTERTRSRLARKCYGSDVMCIGSSK